MIEDFSRFWEAQSAIANFLAVATVLVSLVGAGYATYKKRKATSFLSVEYWVKSATPTPPTAKDLRIAVVDDHPNDYPLAELRRLGYSITDIQSLTLSEIPSLNNYDCILLDINGVLKEDPKYGGFEILKRLKSPTGPFIVAVSSRGFDIRVSEFFTLADQRLKKPIPKVDVEGVLQNAFERRFSKLHAAKRIDGALGFSGNLSRQKKSILKEALQYINKSNNHPEMSKKISFLLSGEPLQKVLADIEIIKG